MNRTPEVSDTDGEAKARSAPSAPTLSVIVPVYNKLRFLPQTIPSMVTAVRADGAAELILVDNGSTDGSWEFLDQYIVQGTAVLRLPIGTVAAVRNRGVAEAAGGLLLFLDCDVVVPPDYLARVREVFRVTGAVGVGCRVGLPSDPTWVEATWHRMHVRSGSGPREWINSGNFAVTREAFARVGGFDESLVSGEDPELCQRLTRAGGVLFEDQRLQVTHLDNAKTLKAFFGKEVWRALGMFGTAKARPVDKPLVMTLAHLGLLLASVLAVSLLVHEPAVWLMGLAATWIVPATAVLYRGLAGHRGFHVLPGILLYQAYFLARIVALGRVGWGLLSRRSPGPA